MKQQIASVALLPTLTLRLDLLSGPGVALSTVAIAVLAGVVLALGPAIGVARLDAAGALRAGRGAPTGDRRSARGRRALVAAQVTLALVLVVSAALLTESATALRATHLGVDLDRLAIVDLDVVPAAAPEAIPGLARAALEAVRALPGVEHTAMASGAPVDSATRTVDVSASGGAIVVPRATHITVTEDYFNTVGVPILAGRAFREADIMAATAIVNETLAARLPDGALDRTIVVAPDRALRVIGIARNAKYLSGTEGAQANVYEVTAPDFHLSIIARAAGDPRPVLVDMQAALDGIGPGVQGFFPRTGLDHVGVDRLATDVGGAAARLVGGLALALSAFALYGLVAWVVEMRRVEFGLRLALGATRADLGRLVLEHAVRSAAPGVLAGVPAAVGVGLLLRGSVAGVGAPTPATIGVALAAMTVVIGAAAWLPARRAARVDPVTLLRAD